MNKLTIFSMLVIFHIAVIKEVTPQCQPVNENLVKTFANKVSEELLIYRGTMAREFECIQQCVNDHRCITVQYSTDSEECRTHAADSTLVESFGVEALYGVNTYQLTGRVGYGVNCINTEQCTVPNSECQPAGCFCKAGHRFSLATGTCDLVRYSLPCADTQECNFDNSVCEDVCLCQNQYLWDPVKLGCDTGCTIYGSSFTIYTGFSLAYYDLKYNLEGEFDVSACEVFCIESEGCKSFAFITTNNHCYLKTRTWLEVGPTNHRHGSERVHGQRNCAN